MKPTPARSLPAIRHLVGRARAPAGLLLLLGCGAAPPPTAIPAPDAAHRVEVDEVDCLLAARGGQVTATCTVGALTCTEIARGDLAEAPGPEVVSRCDAPGDTHVHQALAVASGDRLLWTLPLQPSAFEDDVDGCSLSPEVAIEVVDLGMGGRAALLVHKTQCFSPGLLGDSDSLWTFGRDGATPVATATMACQFRGDTGDPDADPPPKDSAWGCAGAYLAIERGPTGPIVAKLAADESAEVSGDRDAAGRLVAADALERRPLRLDGPSGRFVDQAP